MMSELSDRIETSLFDLPPSLQARSGSVFYTGRAAFLRPSPLYLLGLNPGGDPVMQAEDTVANHIATFRERRLPWSAYADESWKGATPGTWGMQPRVLHLLSQLALDPRLTPASNLIFARTRNENGLRGETSLLIDQCWNVHKAVIAALEIRMIVCFGATVGRLVRSRLSANHLVDAFIEENRRGWNSHAHEAPDGRIVITVTHPSRADWTNVAADPTCLVVRMIDRLAR